MQDVIQILIFFICITVIPLRQSFCLRHDKNESSQVHRNNSPPSTKNNPVSISGIINVYIKVLSISSPTRDKVIVESSSGFGIGTRVVIIQMKGAAINTNNSEDFGKILSYGDAGNFEFSRVTSVNGNEISLIRPLLKTYNPNGAVQLIVVPEYNDVLLSNKLSVPKWDGKTGGVLVLESCGLVTFNGDIDVSGCGFRGGMFSLKNDSSYIYYYYSNVDSGKGGWKGEGMAEYISGKEACRGALTNGGGGGNAHNAGGGGGGNIGNGGRGGNQLRGIDNPDIELGGLGGRALTYSTSMMKIFMGGGGGGHQNHGRGSMGTDGGGIVIIKAAEIEGNNHFIVADGIDQDTVGGNDGQGGGGAGGTILLQVNNIRSYLNISAKGGKGGDLDNNNNITQCHGPGGGGSGGVLWVNGPALPKKSGVTLQGGLPGLNVRYPSPCLGQTHGAYPGERGSVVTGLILPQNGPIYTPMSIQIIPDTSICEGDCVKLTVVVKDGTPPYSYKWLPAAGLSIYDKPDPTVCPPASMQYTVEVQDQSKCNRTYTSAQIIVNPKPTPIIIGPRYICPGGIATYRTYPVSGIRNTWKVRGGTIIGDSTGESVDVYWYKSDTLYVKLHQVIDSSRCSSDSTMYIKISLTPAPNIKVSKRIPICDGDTVMLDAGPGYTSYTWSSGETTQKILVTQPGFYSVTINDSSGCIATSKPVQVIINSAPIPSILIKGSTIFCEGDSVALSTAKSYLKYEWTTGEKTRNIVVKKTGAFAVAVIDSNGCTGTSQPIDIIVSSYPSPQIGGPKKVCLWDITNYITKNVIGHSYKWKIEGGTITSADNSSDVMIKWESIGIGIVELTELNDTAGCTMTVRDTIQIFETPMPVIHANGPTEFCKGDSVILSAPSGYANYHWSNNDTTRSIRVTRSGMYSVTVMNANGCSGLSNSITVAAYPKPIPIITGPTSACINSFIKYRVTSVSNASLIWIVIGGAITSGNTTDSITVQWTNIGLNKIGISVRVDSSGCTGYDSLDVLVSSTLQPIIKTNRSTNLCEGDSVTLDAGAGYATYKWSTGETVQTITVAISGNYFVDVSDVNGCRGTSQPIIVIVNKRPTPIITGINVFCEGDSTILDAGSGFSSYIWSTGELTRTITVKNNGLYSVSVRDSNGCEGSSPTFMVSLNRKPVPLIIGQDSFCEGDSAVLSTLDNYVSYQWSTGNTSQSIIITQPNSYSVTVRDTNGCLGTSLPKIITVHRKPTPVIDGSDYFCEGDSIKLSVQDGYSSYLWSTGDTSNSITVSQSGSYTVTVQDSFRCRGTSTQKVITVLA